ncbi:hypothetical protein AKO1_015715 [Acrasis kona]|uniref:AB hydrolase-1 domain-containing protein n=1 Tax=Acrasis kona TaxID=1008807 RepID=A0AAW2ZIK5_9EUKA
MDEHEVIEQWRQKGFIHNIFDHEIFVIDEQPKSDFKTTSPTICILHGFPSSSMDYKSSLPILSKNHRVILMDFVGFGLSEKPKVEYSYSLMEQADSVIEVWKRLSLTKIHLFGHDYGTSVLTEILARRERNLLPLQFEITSATLCNGSIHIEKCSLSIVQKLLLTPVLNTLAVKLFTKNIFKKVIKGIVSNISEMDLNIMWSLLIKNEGIQVFPKLIQYVNERYIYWNRWIGALRRVHYKSSSLAVMILWGSKDTIARPSIAIEALRDVQRADHIKTQKIVKLKWLPNLGHYPMIEDPGLWSKEFITFINHVEEHKSRGLTGSDGNEFEKSEFESFTLDSWSHEGIHTLYRESFFNTFMILCLMMLLVACLTVLFWFK